VGRLRLRDDPAVGPRKDALGARRSDVHAKQQVDRVLGHGAETSRTRECDE